jgi:hypothetical protein
MCYAPHDAFCSPYGYQGEELKYLVQNPDDISPAQMGLVALGSLLKCQSPAVQTWLKATAVWFTVGEIMISTNALKVDKTSSCSVADRLRCADQT